MIARYLARPEHRRWHKDARIYELTPTLLLPAGNFLVEIGHVIVAGIREWTPMDLEGQPVYRLHTVVYTLDEQFGLHRAWLEGRIDHSAALELLGYETQGKP